MKITIRDMIFVFKDILYMDERAMEYEANPMPFMSWFIKNEEIFQEDDKVKLFMVDNFAIIKEMIHPILQTILVDGDLSKVTHMEYLQFMKPAINAITPKNE